MVSSGKNSIHKGICSVLLGHVDSWTTQLQLYLPTAILHPHIHTPKLCFIRRKSYKKAVASNRYLYATTPNISWAKLIRLVFRAQYTCSSCPECFCLSMLMPREMQINKQLNSKGVWKRHDGDDYYCCGCFQESWEAVAKRFISGERFQSRRVNKATWLVCKPGRKMPKCTALQ